MGAASRCSECSSSESTKGKVIYIDTKLDSQVDLDGQCPSTQRDEVVGETSGCKQSQKLIDSSLLASFALLLRLAIDTKRAKRFRIRLESAMVALH